MLKASLFPLRPPPLSYSNSPQSHSLATTKSASPAKAEGSAANEAGQTSLADQEDVAAVEGSE